MKLCAAGALLWVKPVLYNAHVYASACAEDSYALFMVEIYPMVIMRSSREQRGDVAIR